MKEYPHLILEKLFQRHFLFDNLTNYFPVNGFCLSKFPHYLACEQQTHFRSSLAIFRRERSDDRKCVCCSQATHYPVHKSDLYARSNMRRKRRRSSSFSPLSPTRSLKKDGEQSSEKDAVLTNSFRKFHSVFKMATTFHETEISGGEFFLDKTGCFYSKQF